MCASIFKKEIHKKKECQRNSHCYQGSTTIMAAIIVCIFSILAVSVGVYAMAVMMRHQAQSAADLSALSAAQNMFTAPESACTYAEHIAQANHAALRECSIASFDVIVEVMVVRHIAGFALESIARARAGPEIGY